MTTSSGVLPISFEVGPFSRTPTLSYKDAVISARSLPGEEAYSPYIGSWSVYIDRDHPNTLKKIGGWKWDQRVWFEETQENFLGEIPVNMDPSISGITESYFQPGIGFGSDLELLSINEIPGSGLNAFNSTNIWVPEIRHGYYYDYADQQFLFSDDAEVLYASWSGIVQGVAEPIESGFNLIHLRSMPKVGNPITVQGFVWDDNTGEYDLDINLTKVVSFTGTRDDDYVEATTYDSNQMAIYFSNIDKTENEFMVVYSGTVFSGVTPSIVLNDQYVSRVGSGLIPSGMEILGYSTGNDAQEFHLTYSPIDKTSPVRIITYTTADQLRDWQVLPENSVFSGVQLSGQQVLVDYDLGLIKFGSPNVVSGQLTPSAGETVAASYFRTVKIEYEPEDSVDTLYGLEADINAIHRPNYRGFVYLTNTVEDPTTIDLEAALPEIDTDTYGPLYIGNNYATLIATVYDQKGRKIEGLPVDIFLTSVPTVGSFSGDDDTTSITNVDGEAYAFYTPARSIAEIGGYVTASGWSVDNSPSYSGIRQTTTLRVSDMLIEGDETDIFLYGVYTDDPVLGYWKSDLAKYGEGDPLDQIEQYYKEFFSENEIFGPTGITTPPSGITNDAIEWEYNHRTYWDLVRPTLFNSANGRKVLVASVQSGYIHPHIFEYPDNWVGSGVVAPVQPIDVVSTGTAGEYDIVFDTTFHSIPPPSGTLTPGQGYLHSYFVIAPTSVAAKASVYNQRLNKTIESQEIEVKLDIPSYMNGVWLVDSINQTHIEEISTLLENITASGQRVPLGFRLKSSNISLAAALNGITFLDVNSDPVWDSYYNNIMVQSGLS